MTTALAVMEDTALATVATDSLQMNSMNTVRIVPIDLKTARPFIEHWHYSNKIPAGKNVFFGCFRGEELYAVADYGIGVNPAQEKYLARVTEKPVSKNNLYELKRLCRIEPRHDDLPLTKFLSLCHRVLKAQGIRFIVAFSDPAHNHNGGIYRAANFTHLGQTNAEWHVIDHDGNVRHRRFALRYMNRHNDVLPANAKPMTLSEARKRLGLIPISTPPKDRWFLDLGANHGQN